MEVVWKLHTSKMLISTSFFRDLQKTQALYLVDVTFPENVSPAVSILDL